MTENSLDNLSTKIKMRLYRGAKWQTKKTNAEEAPITHPTRMPGLAACVPGRGFLLRLERKRSMEKAPAFQLYASDFYMDTNGWSALEVGVYFRLLMSEWVNGQLPDDTQRLSRIAQIDQPEFVKLWQVVLRKKFVKDGSGLLVNKRLEQVRQKQAVFRESQSKKGHQGAEARWNKEIANAMPGPLAGDQPEDSSSSSSSSSSSYKESSSLIEAKNPDVKECIDFYYQAFNKQFGNPPIIEGPKDGKLIKSLLKTIPLNELKSLFKKFFDSDDPFIQKSGYTIGVFKSQINKLRIGKQKHPGLRSWANEIMEEEDAGKR